jgi:hypothetical protein
LESSKDNTVALHSPTGILSAVVYMGIPLAAFKTSVRSCTDPIAVVYGYFENIVELIIDNYQKPSLQNESDKIPTLNSLLYCRNIFAVKAPIVFHV